MATATQILDRASYLTGLRATGTERTLAFQALQNAYNRAVMDSECYIASATATMTGGTDNYAVTALCGSATPLKMREVVLQQGGGQTLIKLHGVAEGQMLEMQRGSTNNGGIPQCYATLGTTRVLLYPAPSTGDVLRTYYVPAPPTLVESTATPGASEEITPSYVPVQFHWDVLLAGCVVEMLDKDQRAQDVQFWEGRYMDGIARMREWSASFMGEANPAWVDGSSGNGFYWDDQRSRR